MRIEAATRPSNTRRAEKSRGARSPPVWALPNHHQSSFITEARTGREHFV